jgi:DeoR/GlpR family transcriptional regulator of sugar metabolism
MVPAAVQRRVDNGAGVMAAQIKVDRLTSIREHLYAHGSSTNQELVAATGVSLATLRRDLTVLEEEGVIDRVHGGARLAAGSNVEIGFEQREKENLAAKRNIADTAYERIKPHTAIFLDSATTVLQLARRLRIMPMPITIFTNSLAATHELLNVSKIRVVIVGGQVRSENASAVGPFAEGMLEKLWFDQLFLGAGAVGDNGSIYSIDLNEASLNAKMLARSAERILLADASKFGKSATYAVAPISGVNLIISDLALTVEWRQRLLNLGVDLKIAVDGRERAR